MVRAYIRKTKLYQFLKDSFGDYRYPWLVFKWQLAAWLVRRKEVRVGPVQFSLPCSNPITHFRWYLFKNKEVEVRNYIDQYVQNGDIFFDVGANIGVFSIYAAKRFTGLNVYSFEPEYSNLNLLKENVIANSLLERVRIYSVAVSDFIGLSQLHLQDLSAGAACHSENQNELQVTDEGYRVKWSEGVSSVTLDYVCQQLKVIPNALKIDTDGNEEKILRGAHEVLRNPGLRSLVLEMPMDGQKQSACRKLLQEAGLKLIWSDDAKTRNQIWAR